MDDPDESIIKLDDSAFKTVQRSSLHNLKTVTWLRKRRIKSKSKKYVDPGKTEIILTFTLTLIYIAQLKYGKQWPNYIHEE